MRWHNGEVDMIAMNERTQKPSWALEIKWSNLPYQKPGKLKSLLKFCIENDLNDPIVTNIDKEGNVDYNEKNIQYLPAASYAYTVGRNALEG